LLEIFLCGTGFKGIKKDDVLSFSNNEQFLGISYSRVVLLIRGREIEKLGFSYLVGVILRYVNLFSFYMLMMAMR